MMTDMAEKEPKFFNWLPTFGWEMLMEPVLECNLDLVRQFYVILLLWTGQCLSPLFEKRTSEWMLPLLMIP